MRRRGAQGALSLANQGSGRCEMIYPEVEAVDPFWPDTLATNQR